MQAIISHADVRDSRRAGLVAAGAFIVGFVVFGILYSFGSFFDAISKELNADNTATSAFFAIIGLAFYFCGPLCGYLSDRLGPRLLVSAGAILAAAGLILTSRIETICQRIHPADRWTAIWTDGKSGDSLRVVALFGRIERWVQPFQVEKLTSSSTPL